MSDHAPTSPVRYLPDPEVREFRIRIVHFGLQAQWLALLVLGASSVLARGMGEDIQPEAELIIGAALTVLVTVLPWRRIVGTRLEIPVLAAWSIGLLIVVTMAIDSAGGGRSNIFVVYGLTVVLSSALFSLTMQTVMLMVTYAFYIGVLWRHDFNVDSPDLVLRLGSLAVLMFLAGHLSWELIRQKEAHLAANSELVRRAEVLAAVARAAREMTLRSSSEVLDVVVDTAIELGFATADLSLFSDDGSTYTMAHVRGWPEVLVRADRPSTEGMTGRVVATGKTLAVADYSSFDASVEDFAGVGVGALISTPIYAEGKMVGVLSAARWETGEPSEEEIEVFELLASLAGRALEGARRFAIERESVARLEELDRMKSDFITTVSHELRTPLTAIQGMGRTLVDRWDDLDDEVRRELIGRLTANADSLHRIIVTLLDFSRIEAGRLDTQPVAIDLKQLVHDVTDRLEGLFVTHPLATSVDSGTTVWADPVLLERVLENLLANAIQHTPPGTRVALAAAPEAAGIRISVSDTGPGIAPADLERIGERFFRGGDPNTRPSG
ncbi:MAG: GAF domain-containing protein, partial [Actinobacteria bacterium]|nr:GAF domain-containing protein [Actinomycetota bacterium]